MLICCPGWFATKPIRADVLVTRSIVLDSFVAKTLLGLMGSSQNPYYSVWFVTKTLSGLMARHKTHTIQIDSSQNPYYSGWWLVTKPVLFRLIRYKTHLGICSSYSPSACSLQHFRVIGDVFVSGLFFNHLNGLGCFVETTTRVIHTNLIGSPSIKPFTSSLVVGDITSLDIQTSSEWFLPYSHLFPFDARCACFRREVIDASEGIEAERFCWGWVG